MDYDKIRIIPNAQANCLEDLCRKSFLKNCILFAAANCILIFIWIYAGSFSRLSVCIRFLVLFFFLFLFCFYIGGLGEEGVFLGWFRCKKSVQDWISFAKAHTLIPYPVILSRELEYRGLDVIRVSLDEKKIWCRNRETGFLEIFTLSDLFREEFEIRNKDSLSAGEIILDLREQECVAYIRESSE